MFLKKYFVFEKILKENFLKDPIRITARDKSADESVFFRAYQQVQPGLAESCALFLLRLRSTFRQLVRYRIREYKDLPCWNGKVEITSETRTCNPRERINCKTWNVSTKFAMSALIESFKRMPLSCFEHNPTQTMIILKEIKYNRNLNLTVEKNYKRDRANMSENVYNFCAR